MNRRFKLRVSVIVNSPCQVSSINMQTNKQKHYPSIKILPTRPVSNARPIRNSATPPTPPPSTRYITLMGLILSIVAPITQQVKERRQRKREKKSVKCNGAHGSEHVSQGATGAQHLQQPSLPHPSTLERGLQAEVDSSRPPPSSRAAVPAEALPAQERRVREDEQITNTLGELDGARTGGEPTLQRQVGIAAPVPLAA
jgi:hypothetical protein